MTTIQVKDAINYRIIRCARLSRKHLLGITTELGHGLTPEQWFIMNKLRLQEGQSQVELADEMFADRPNVTRILKTMEREGLIRRTSDPADARRTLVFLTKKGKNVHDRVADWVPEGRRRITAGIDPNDLGVVVRVLDQLEANMLKLMNE